MQNIVGCLSSLSRFLTAAGPYSTEMPGFIAESERFFAIGMG